MVPNNAGASAIFKLFQARPALLGKRIKRLLQQQEKHDDDDDNNNVDNRHDRVDNTATTTTTNMNALVSCSVSGGAKRPRRLLQIAQTDVSVTTAPETTRSKTPTAANGTD